MKQKKKLNWHEKERQARWKRRLKATGEIDFLQYKFIEQGFYEVQAVTWGDKISFEGNMCGGLLKQFIKKVLSEGGKVERVSYSLVDKEVKNDLRQAERELATLRKKNKQAIRLLKY